MEHLDIENNETDDLSDYIEEPIERKLSYKKAFKRNFIANVKVALNHLDNCYQMGHFLVKAEDGKSAAERDALYDYGVDLLKFHLVKISNAQKSLNSILMEFKYYADRVEKI